MPNPHTNKHAPQLVKEQIEQAAAMYNSGIGGETIALHFGVTRQTIYYHLKKRNIERRECRWAGEENPLWRGGSPADSKMKYVALAAVKAGFLERPAVCQACGRPSRGRGGKNNLHAHHDDYNQPLTVRWLCLSCDIEWHRSNEPVPLRK